MVRLSRFVGFSEENFASFSVEMARLLLAAGSEVDVVAKQLCRAVDPTSKLRRMYEYRKALRGAHPSMEQFEVEIPRFALSFQPWRSWVNHKKPSWWDAYN